MRRLIFDIPIATAIAVLLAAGAQESDYSRARRACPARAPVRSQHLKLRNNRQGERARKQTLNHEEASLTVHIQQPPRLRPTCALITHDDAT